MCRIPRCNTASVQSRGLQSTVYVVYVPTWRNLCLPKKNRISSSQVQVRTLVLDQLLSNLLQLKDLEFSVHIAIPCYPEGHFSTIGGGFFHQLHNRGLYAALKQLRRTPSEYCQTVAVKQIYSIRSKIILLAISVVTQTEMAVALVTVLQWIFSFRFVALNYIRS